MQNSDEHCQHQGQRQLVVPSAHAASSWALGTWHCRAVPHLGLGSISSLARAGRQRACAAAHATSPLPRDTNKQSTDYRWVRAPVQRHPTPRTAAQWAGGWLPSHTRWGRCGPRAGALCWLILVFPGLSVRELRGYGQGYGIKGGPAAAARARRQEARTQGLGRSGRVPRGAAVGKGLPGRTVARAPERGRRGHRRSLLPMKRARARAPRGPRARFGARDTRGRSSRACGRGGSAVGVIYKTRAQCFRGSVRLHREGCVACLGCACCVFGAHLI